MGARRNEVAELPSEEDPAEAELRDEHRWSERADSLVDDGLSAPFAALTKPGEALGEARGAAGEARSGVRPSEGDGRPSPAGLDGARGSAAGDGGSLPDTSNSESFRTLLASGKININLHQR